MNRLFDIDGPAMRFVTKIAYSAYLNVLWFLCCLPVVTVGASTTALFYVTLKIAKNEEGNLTRAFFHSFKENFRQSTVIWLIMLALGIVLGVDGYVFYHMRFDSALWTIGAAIFLVALTAYLIVLMYIFPLVAHFENTTRAMFQNAIMIGMRFLWCTALMAAVYFVMTLVVVRIFTPAIVFGEGLCALLCSYLLSNIMTLCEDPREPQDGAEVSAQADETEPQTGVKVSAQNAGAQLLDAAQHAADVSFPAAAQAGAKSPASSAEAQPLDAAQSAADVSFLAAAQTGAESPASSAEAQPLNAAQSAADVSFLEAAQTGAESPASSAKKKAREKEYRLSELHGRKKLRYLWDYYKLPFCAACICLYIVGYMLYGHFAHKDTVLYTALVNMDVGEDLTAGLSSGYLDYVDRNASKEKLELYRGLYLTEDPNSAYYDYNSASRTRIVASIDRECLDVVLMNREAFDAFAQGGYLLNIETFLKENSPQLFETLRGDLVSNTVILEDNALDVQLDPSIPYSAETDAYPMGIDLSASPLIRQAGFDDTVYLGVVANTPRAETVISYLEYLYQP